jgi:hypothetical protein
MAFGRQRAVAANWPVCDLLHTSSVHRELLCTDVSLAGLRALHSIFFGTPDLPTEWLLFQSQEEVQKCS